MEKQWPRNKRKIKIFTRVPMKLLLLYRSLKQNSYFLAGFSHVIAAWTPSVETQAFCEFPS